MFDASGVFTARTASLVDRGVFGWQLGLSELVLGGNWQQRTVAATVAGQLTLPHAIATLPVSGAINTAVGQYKLLGVAGGSFGLGSALPFTYSTAPELTETRFALSGRLALGPQTDAASYDTRLEISKAGHVAASFSGLTPWTSFAGVGHARLGWVADLRYDGSGLPNLAFRGRLGVSAPQHPENIEDLPEGVGVLVSQKPRITASLRNPDKPTTVTPQGQATFHAEPAFQGKTFFQFNIRPGAGFEP